MHGGPFTSALDLTEIVLKVDSTGKTLSSCDANTPDTPEIWGWCTDTMVGGVDVGPLEVTFGPFVASSKLSTGGSPDELDPTKVQDLIFLVKYKVG